MVNAGKLFADKLTEWLLEKGFVQFQCQLFIYYKYLPYRKQMLFCIMLMNVSIVILMKLLEKWSGSTIGNRLRVNFL